MGFEVHTQMQLRLWFEMYTQNQLHRCFEVYTQKRLCRWSGSSAAASYYYWCFESWVGVSLCSRVGNFDHIVDIAVCWRWERERERLFADTVDQWRCERRFADTVVY